MVIQSHRNETTHTHTQNLYHKPPKSLNNYEHKHTIFWYNVLRQVTKSETFIWHTMKNKMQVDLFWGTVNIFSLLSIKLYTLSDILLLNQLIKDWISSKMIPITYRHSWDYLVSFSFCPSFCYCVRLKNGEKKREEKNKSYQSHAHTHTTYIHNSKTNLSVNTTELHTHTHTTTKIKHKSGKRFPC